MGTEFDDLEARTTIHFPYSVGISEVREMFGIIAEARAYVFDFTTKTHERIGDRFHYPEKVQLINERYILDLGGTVRDSKCMSAQFVCHSNTNYDHPQGPKERFEYIKFETTPGIDTVAELELENRVTDNLGIMDGVREGVRNYFESITLTQRKAITVS